MLSRPNFLKQQIVPFLASAGTTFFGGLSYIAKRLLLVLSPLQVASSRFLIAAVALSVIGLAGGRLAKISLGQLSGGLIIVVGVRSGVGYSK